MLVDDLRIKSSLPKPFSMVRCYFSSQAGHGGQIGCVPCIAHSPQSMNIVWLSKKNDLKNLNRKSNAHYWLV